MNRDQLVAAIMDATKITEFATNEKAASAAESQAYGEMVRENMKDLSPQTIERLKAASEKYERYVSESWSIEEFMPVWSEAYYADFTDAELRAILEHAKSPIGQKEIAAAKRANIKAREFVFARCLAAARVANRINSEETAKIFADEYRDKNKD